MAWYDDNELDHASALAIAKHLDAPRRRHDDVEVKGGHVWHCSLSLRAEEGSRCSSSPASSASMLSG